MILPGSTRRPVLPETDRRSLVAATGSESGVENAFTSEIVPSLLSWYDRNGRRLPWRVSPRDRARGMRPDPYRVWLSEIMLQQTRVVTVLPYFEAFLRSWPSVNALAEAPVEAVMDRWAGLGYYARARNLHACAQRVTTRYGGRFPAGEAELRSLPGIGAYTSAAIAAIAFDAPTVPVDGNVERVTARLHFVQEPLPGARPRLRALAQLLAGNLRPGDLAQALMDLGATVCTPKNPDCPRCPLQSGCAANRQNLACELPRRAPKRVRPVRYGVVMLAMRKDGSIWLSRRTAKGLLGGMSSLPGTDWKSRRPSEEEIEAATPFPGDWLTLPGNIRHVFTHFELRLQVRTATVENARGDAPGGTWISPDEWDPSALPSVMRKAVQHFLRQDAGAPGGLRGHAGARGTQVRTQTR